MHVESEGTRYGISYVVGPIGSAFLPPALLSSFCRTRTRTHMETNCASMPIMHSSAFVPVVHAIWLMVLSFSCNLVHEFHTRVF